MIGLNQHNRFRQRIQIERRILGIINNKFSNYYQLSGLTDASINLWHTEINKILPNIDFSKLIIDLKQISKLARINNDMSREVFSREEIAEFNGLDIDKLIAKMENSLIYLC